jgi:8-oxo-dGTP pyrophosphatase MutT (NUDIX family)
VSCREAIEVLDDFIDGVMPAELAAELERHLAGCEPCRAYLATYRKARALGVAAARELEEETGYRAARFERLAEFYPAPGFADEHMTLYLATGLTEGTQGQMEDEDIAGELLPLDEVPARLARGDVRDAKTLVGLLLARERLDGAAGR